MIAALLEGVVSLLAEFGFWWLVSGDDEDAPGPWLAMILGFLALVTLVALVFLREGLALWAVWGMAALATVTAFMAWGAYRRWRDRDGKRRERIKEM